MENKALKGITHGWAQRALSTTRLAASAAQLATRRLVGASGETDFSIGIDLAAELDAMKGMAMKVGQILSYMDGILPEETHRALRTLQTGGRPVEFDTMRAVIEQELGGKLESLFDSFDPNPVASASIGQVYRAVLRGKPVAVKVQYPQVRETMDADFGRLKVLSRVASLATEVDGVALVNELRERIDEECDYRREAQHLTDFRRAFAGDPQVLIPDSCADRSGERVLTMDWCEGRGFYEFLEKATREERTSVGLLLARFAYRSLFVHQALNADPHPGNYLFQGDGRVVFLDFGCVRSFDPGYLERERVLARVVVEDRRRDFREALLATGMVPSPNGFDFDAHWQLLTHQYAPYRVPHFRFDFEYVKRAGEFGHPSNPNLRRLAIPPAWIWIQRLQFGLHAVLARLEAEGNFAEILQEALDEPVVALSA
jgi:predicted unusual protein kinase regulating ubiquinone biosynthesis (AarF/ABC1/UbiB family)